ncbi:hypothetical protein ACRALDRAFT_2042239 [Sodiomyces alcalophilus JCM 7366]|uniref:uncharacterized protein n=1 Tax=Sodiomyces alcalophilus JCM 7366 TaxID=591952 RepID=UPI0039B37FAC
MSAMESEAVVGAIRAARVPYPYDELLTVFIQRAADSERAAQHLWARCGTPDGTLAKTSIDAFLADWEQLVRLFERSGPGKPLRDAWVADTIRRREDNTCRLTGRKGTWRDPLAVYPILQLPEASLGQLGNLPRPLHEILYAFLGDDIAEWVCAGCRIESPLANHWLVLRSAAETFALGFWRVEPMEGYPHKLVIFTQGPYGLSMPLVVGRFNNDRGILVFDRGPDLESPDSRALQTTGCFAEPIRLLATCQVVPFRPSLLSRLSLPLSAFLRTAGTPIFWSIWFFWIRSPESWRFRVYSALARVGRAIYGRSASFYVQQLPFGMYIKTHTTSTIEAAKNEFGALELIRNSSNLNVPQPLDLVFNERRSYMITGRLPGVTAQSLYATLSDEQLVLLAKDLSTYLAELRRIQKPPGLSNAAISNSIGGGCIHNRIDKAHGTTYEPHGPFPDEATFHDYLLTRRPPAPNEVQRTGHAIRFSHGDLALRNIIVDSWGRLVGLVDWENAGWYPDYWELTAFHGTIPQRRWENVCSHIFPYAQDFEYEVAVEDRLWAYL